MGRTRSSFFWVAGFAGASVLNLLGLAGLADSVVEWQCFLNVAQIVASYLAMRAFLFQFVPFTVPDLVKDYLIITASFSVMLIIYAHIAEKKSVREIMSENGRRSGVWFAVALFAAPWIVLLWLAARQVQWRAAFERARRILSPDNADRKRLEGLKSREDEKARILAATVIGYPVLCLALLFVFTDFASTLTGITDIGGLSLTDTCPASGAFIRPQP